MSAPIFDQQAGRLRRNRAARSGGDRFLHDRALDDCLERLADMSRRFESVLVIGDHPETPVAALKAALPDAIVTASNPTGLSQLVPGSFDLCVSIGELETSDDLSTAAFVRRHLLAPGGLLLGALIGGDSLPLLRSAMLAADQAGGGASPRVHPSVDGPSLSALLGSVGLVDPVIEIDRIDVRYASLGQLVNDLRAMGCTNILTQRSRRPLTRTQLEIASRAFLGGGSHATERFELLHFTAWAPQSDLATTS